MVSGDNVTVTLTGGSPWGFRLTGGGSMPLQIAKIRKKSQAHAQGLQEGDAVVSINGIPVHDRSHDQAVDLIDSAGDTLTLQIYRGDADDLGQLLASSKHHAPLLPPQAEGQGDVVVSSSTSTTSVTEAEGRRREMQQNVFVTKDGNTESTTFVRREHTITTSSDVGDVNGNDVGVGGRDRNLTAQIEVSTSLESAPIVSLSPKPAASPKPSSPKPSLSPHKPVSPKPVSPVPFDPSPQVHFPGSVSGQPQPQSQIQVQIQPRPAADGPVWVPKGPTFKAVPPKVAPGVAPKPVLKQQQFTVKPIFNAKAVATAATPSFAPQKFQVSATAMYSQQPQSPGGQQVKFQPQQQYSPAMKQHLSQQNSQPYSPGSQQLFSPMSNSSPLSPVSQPFSPISPSGSSMPMFNVRNNAGEGARTWLPNMWLPGQEPNEEPENQQQQQQQPQQRYQHPPPQQNHHNENIEIPNRMSIKERQQMLLNHAAATKHSLSARQADPDFDAPSEEMQRMASHKMKIFGPPVEMSTQGPLEHWDGMHLERADSVESDGSSPTSSLNRKKKMYADSAFYEDPTHKYPTIDEQMKLCRLISNSLTSAANKRARGAKMFAKRKRKSQKWVHESHSEWSSSAGDVGNIEELESELGVEEGGIKQLFMFRIPKLKQRISSPERNTKMSMKKDEFERLRLQGQKCDHRTVSPGTCFDIAADLKAHRGRGGRLFERRKNRADKFIIDESNAKMVGPKTTKLDNILGTAPLKSSQSPWEAAQSNQAGKVDSAFDHLNDIERMQKMKQMMKVYTPPKPAQPTREVLQPLNPPPPAKGPKTDLRGSGVNLLQGRNFNRFAKGWCASGGDMQDRAGSMAAHHAGPQQQQHAQNHHSHQTHMGAQDYPVESAPRGQPRVHFGDYNPRPRAWQSAAQPGDSYSCPASMSASWASSDFDSYHHSPSGAAGGGGGLYSPNELPASDL